MAPCEVTLALLLALAPAGAKNVSPGRPAGRPGASSPWMLEDEAATARAPLPPATVLSTVRAEVIDGRLRILLRGNGRLSSAAARYGRGAPPRVLIEMPGVRSEVEAVTRVARLGVQQVRVETSAATPPVTRIVVDLSSRQLFALWRVGERGEDLAVLFGEADPAPRPEPPPAVPDIAPSVPVVTPPVTPPDPLPSPEPTDAASGADPADAATARRAAPPIATRLSGIEHTTSEGRVRIVLRGNGRLEPRAIEYARDLPPRVLVDLPGIRADVRAVTHVRQLGVEKVRVGTNSVSPLVTRVVMDLSSLLPFEVVRDVEDGSAVVLLFGGKGPSPTDESPSLERPTTPIASADGTSEPGAADTGSSETPPWMLSVARSNGRQALPLPDPVYPAASRSASGPGFVGLRGFRAALGVGHDRWNTQVRDGYAVGYDRTMTSPLVTLQGSFWLVDPRILTIDAMADLRFDWQQYSSDVLETETSDTLENYRVNAVLLSGRGSPLTLYFDRAGSFLDQRQTPIVAGELLALSQTGRQTTRGFSWDLNTTRLPHVSASGSLTDRSNVGSFLSGWDSSSRQERFDLRADREHRLFRYELGYSHDKSRFEYPLATLSTNYAADIVRGSTRITPRPTLNLTAGARMTTFAVGRTDDLDRQRSFTGAGGNVGLQWRWSPRWRLDAQYNTSSNESEIALSQMPEAPADDSLSIAVRRRFHYQDFDGRVTYTAAGGLTTASAFVRGLSLDPISFGMPTLDTLTMAGGQVDVRGAMAGFDLSAGVEAAAGQSTSNRGDTAPYREASGRLQASRRVAALAFSANAGLRDTEGSFFYPVTGRSWFGGLDLTYDASRRVQLRGSASRSFLLRDVIFQRGDDRTASYRAGLRGPRFDVAVEYADTQSTAEGLLETALLADTDPAVLLATRPELFGFLYASQQLRRAIDARVTLLRGLDLFARGRLDRLELPNPDGNGFLNQNIGQVGAILGVRQLQVEIGWEYLEYWSHLVSTVDRRFQVRVRRDLLIR